MALKAVLIGPRGTVYKDGKAQTNLLKDLIVFIRRMCGLGVHVGLWSRHSITYTHQGRSEPIENFLTRRTGITVPFYRAGTGNLPIRRRGGSVTPILQHLGVQPEETILVGNDDE